MRCCAAADLSHSSEDSLSGLSIAFEQGGELLNLTPEMIEVVLIPSGSREVIYSLLEYGRWVSVLLLLLLLLLRLLLPLHLRILSRWEHGERCHLAISRRWSRTNSSDRELLVLL